jgi:hypothetical protein
MKQNPRNQIFLQDRKNESPEEKFQEQKIRPSQERKNPELSVLLFQEKIRFEEIMRLCKRFKMPQGKRRFDEVKTKFKE